MKKQFIRTMPGKVTLFISVIIFLFVTAVCAASAAVMAATGFYNKPKGALCNQYIRELMYSDANKEGKDAINFHMANGGVYESSPEGTNFRYEIYDKNGQLIGHTIGADYEANQGERSICHYFDLVNEGNHVRIRARYEIPTADVTEFDYKLYAYTEEGLPVSDIYTLLASVISFGYTMRYTVYPIGAAALLLAIICFIALMCVSARKPNSDELFPGALNGVPIDLLIAAFIFFCVMGILCSDVFLGDVFAIIFICIWGLLALLFLLGLCMSVAARLKQKTLLTNTVVWRGLKLIWRILKLCVRALKKIYRGIAALFSGIPLVWKTGALLAGISFAEFIVIVLCDAGGEVVLFWFLEKLVLIPAALCVALVLRKLQKGGSALASGDLGYQIDTSRMVWDFKKHGENLNSIAEGMNQAVEQRMKSERIKTELITNVSHDIKTPLTSIINYADLIGRETCDNKNIAEYSEVLVRQSERLKRLLEDLVEASKASTGNLEVLLAPCDAEIFITQISGEYEQKLTDAGLELIVNRPDKPIKVLADGRRMLRVFDNLMNNICKYSQNGTRVYISVEEDNGDTVITFKNTSREALNISADELMERFVRGDSSRNTEGNGLGLSIAKSLTELQNGTMDLSIDGDLFKVTLCFHTVK